MNSTALVQFAQKAVIVLAGRILLVRKADSDPHSPGKWELPGGRLKFAETLDDALVREAWEETGIKVAPGEPLAMWSWQLGERESDPRVVAVARLCSPVGDVVPSLEHLEPSDHISSFAWFPFETVLDQDLIHSARGPLAKCLERLKR